MGLGVEFARQKWLEKASFTETIVLSVAWPVMLLYFFGDLAVVLIFGLISLVFDIFDGE